MKTITMNEPQDISAASVEFARRMYEQAAVDAEFRKYYQRQLDERQAREKFVTRIIDGDEPARWTKLEIYGAATVLLALVAVWAFVICEIIRLVKTYGF